MRRTGNGTHGSVGEAFHKSVSSAIATNFALQCWTKSVDSP